MLKILITAVVAMMFFSSCETEIRDGHHYHHARGWEHENHPDHHEQYNHGYHHDAHGGEIIIHP